MARAITNVDILLMNSDEGEQISPKIQLKSNRQDYKFYLKMSFTDRNSVSGVF